MDHKANRGTTIPVDVMTTGPGLRIVRGYAALNKESQQLQPDDIKSSGESGTVTLVPLMIDDYVPLVIESFTIPQKELLARL